MIQNQNQVNVNEVLLQELHWSRLLKAQTFEDNTLEADIAEMGLSFCKKHAVECIMYVIICF